MGAMPGHGEIDDQEIEDLVKNGGLKPDTLQRRKKVGEDFSKFVEETLAMPVQDLISGERAQLEQAVIKYFGTIRLKSEENRKTELAMMDKMLDFVMASKNTK